MLGGRKEVIAAPAVELLQFMDMELKREEYKQEKERYTIWLNYLISMYTQPSFGKEDPKFIQSRKEFIEGIKPKEKKGPAIIYEYDFELLKRLKASQEGGG